MASLKEIKGRIASVGSTLKITSAMKMVASAKLHKAQQAICNMLPYERQLHSILLDLMVSSSASSPVPELVEVPAHEPAGRPVRRQAPDESILASLRLSTPSAFGVTGSTGDLTTARPIHRVAIVAFSSNSSLCGAFNSNVIRETLSVINEYRAAGLVDSDITVYSIGRKMQDAMKKAGFPSPADFTRMADSPSYGPASVLAQELLDGFSSGRFDKVELVWNHFKSTASQPTTRQTYLPMSVSDVASPGTGPSSPAPKFVEGPAPFPEDFIVEPSPEELLADLLPKVIRLRIYTTLLDSNAAEHAARTVAMQTATDNGNELLQELTLEYNKGRQQKITSEILDIVGGSLQ